MVPLHWLLRQEQLRHSSWLLVHNQLHAGWFPPGKPQAAMLGSKSFLTLPNKELMELSSPRELALIWRWCL